MGTLADSGLILQAPFIAYETAHAYDGASFLRILEPVVDASGDPLDFTDLTATCTAWTKVGGDLVVTFDTVWSTVDAHTRLTIRATDDAMRGLAKGRRNRVCVWQLTLSDGIDELPVWSAVDSNLIIHGRD